MSRNTSLTLWLAGHERALPPQSKAAPIVAQRRYGFINFLFDATMVVITGGFWLIYLFVREMRRAK